MKKITKRLIILIQFFCLPTFSQVGIGTNAPTATLDINGNLAIRSVASNTTNTSGLTIGADNKVYKTVLPVILAFQRMQIPPCNSISVGSSGSYTQVAAGVTYTVTWNVLVKDTGTAANLANNEKAQKLQVRYNFSPALPFTPTALFMTANSEVASDGNTFSLNYASVTSTSLTVNITRTEMNSAESISSNCWAASYFFDLMILNQ